jgi:hypothetical protein
MPPATRRSQKAHRLSGVARAREIVRRFAEVTTSKEVDAFLLPGLAIQ